MARKRRRNQVEDMVDTAEVVPGADAARGSKRRYRAVRRALTLSPFMTAFCALEPFVAVGLLIQNTQPGSRAAPEFRASRAGRLQVERSMQDRLDRDG